MPGIFYFAWVLPSETVFGVEHHVENEKIISFAVEQSEGDFAALSVDIRNPRIGLLAPTRKTWIWFSYNNGATVIPLFFGRLVGIPNDIQDEIIRLQFTARPSDFGTVKAALAETLKVAPWYDPIWIDPAQLNDPDTVLEARSALWHIDRVTHDVTISDLLIAEDGTQEFFANEVPYDSVKIALNQTPLRSVTVDAIVNWKQSGKGSVIVIPSQVIQTFTGDGLISDWPKAEASFGGGWKVGNSHAIDVKAISSIDSSIYSPSNINFQGNAAQPGTTIPNNWIGKNDGWLSIKTVDWTFILTVLEEGVIIPKWDISISLSLDYETSRDRVEHVRFKLDANVQPLITLAGEDETILLNLSSSDVGEPLPSLELPIVDVRRGAYFPTDRGRNSVEYLIALARANLLLRSRAVKVSFNCSLDRAIELSCRKSVLLHDHRLPGGECVGKITHYGFSLDGNTGQAIGNVTIGCAVGYGGSIAALEGAPDYVEEGYFNTGEVQTYSGGSTILPGGDVSYSIPAIGVVDDGLNLFAVGTQLINNITWHNLAAVQRVGLLAHITSNIKLEDQVKNLEDYLKTIPTSVDIEMKSIEGGPFEAAYDLTTSVLEIPKMIDLEYETIPGTIAAKERADVVIIGGTA
jgi:hypothetical protein